ncbi:hypothetical protein JXL19_05260 [bacterium]|nr:hypothetical protein [bacterium]
MNDIRLKPVVSIVICLLILCGFTGCAHRKTKVFVNPNINFKFVKKVAVLPFENLSNDRFADKKVRDIFVTALLASEALEVPELGDVLQVVNSLGIDAGLEQAGLSGMQQDKKQTGTITKETAKAIGQALGVQGIILGSVEEYSVIRTTSGSFPEVSLTLRMIDPKTGSIIWAISHTEKGSLILPSILGIGEETLTETAIKAAKRVVDTLVFK